MLNKNIIKKAFQENKLKIKSVSKNGTVEYKQLTDVIRHYSAYKNIHKIVLENKKQVIVTEDHSLFIFENGQIKIVQPKDYPKEIVIIENDKIKLTKIIVNEIIEKREFTFDLSVKDNENFVLESGILAHNSFAAPSSEQTIQGFTRVRGYRWPDESLYSHLMQAVNFINLYPPDTGFTLENVPAVWQPLVLQQAMVYALWDLSILWINEEFSYSLNGISLDIQRSDKYQGAASSLQDTVSQQLEIAKKRIHIIKGLGQSRHLFSRGAALGPWTGGQNIRRWIQGGPFRIGMGSVR
jgi:intein/homing endonuclease